MTFLKTPPNSQSNFLLQGTDEPESYTVVNADFVTIRGFGGDDTITLQNSDSAIFGYNVNLGDGADRFQAGLDNSQFGNGSFAILNSTILGGDGNDIIFADSLGGLADDARTSYVINSNIQGNAGNDLIRIFGAISSFIGGGADQDTIELRIPDVVEDDVTPVNDRWSGSTITGGSGDDLIRIDTRDNSVLGTRIEGGAGDDIFASGAATGFDDADIVSGFWTGTTVFGGAGEDFFFFADATSDLYLVGGADDDLILSGLGDDTIEGREGEDVIIIAGGQNLVFGQGDDDEIDIAGNGNNTVNGGGGGDDILITGNGNNFVQADDDVANGGADTIIIVGDGQNTVFGGDFADTITIEGNGDALVFAGNGADVVTTEGTVGGRFFLGAGHDEFTVTDVGSNSVSVFGGSGYDIIDATNSLDSNIEGGLQADIVDFSDTGIGVLVQQDGDSMAATAIISNDTFWNANDIIEFDNGVDIVTGFQAGVTFLDTTIGDSGLDSISGELNNAFGLQVFDGMVENQTYYLTGTWTFGGGDTPNDSDGFFTVAAAGLDSLIVTQGNNGPITFNTNSLVMIGVGAGDGIASIENINTTTVI